MSERKYFDYDETKLTPSQAAKKRWKERNRESYLAQQRKRARERYAEDPEKYNERHKNWREANPEKYKESLSRSAKKLYAANPEKYKALASKWEKNNMDS